MATKRETMRSPELKKTYGNSIARIPQQASRAIFMLLLLYGVSAFFLPHASIVYTTTLAQGEPIIPDKPKLTPTAVVLPLPEVELVRYYTEPAQLRAQEPFVLFLEIKNSGRAPAHDYIFESEQCAPEGFILRNECRLSIPSLGIGESTLLKFHLRYIQASDGANAQSSFIIKHRHDSNISESYTLHFLFLPARGTISDETPELERPFPKPKLVVHRSWVAKARATIDELLTQVPLVIATLPSGTKNGGPEFELVIELQNQGSVEAMTIYIDFCDEGDNFNPVYSGCRKAVPTTLHPGESAIASQTLAYDNVITTTLQRGETVTVTVSYEFWYIDQLIRESLSHTVYLYPQPFPAVTPIPSPAGNHETGIVPDLVVNTPQLNVRYGPGTNYPVLGVTYQGVRYPVSGRYDDWWLIEFSGTILAWVHGDYVIVRGADKVDRVTQIPETPAPAPTFTPNPNPVGSNERAMTSVPVQLRSTVEPQPLDQASFVQTERSTLLPLLIDFKEQVDGLESAPANAATTAHANMIAMIQQNPFIIIDSYQTIPAQPQRNEPFLLVLHLHNIGIQPAKQLFLNWEGTEILPVGSGAIQQLPDLPANTKSSAQGYFVLQQTIPNAVNSIPVQIIYTDSSGKLIMQVEEITLIRPAAALSALETPSTAAGSTRPLWRRVLFGLVGLGAE